MWPSTLEQAEAYLNDLRLQAHEERLVRTMERPGQGAGGSYAARRVAGRLLARLGRGRRKQVATPSPGHPVCSRAPYAEGTD